MFYSCTCTSGSDDGDDDHSTLDNIYVLHTTSHSTIVYLHGRFALAQAQNLQRAFAPLQRDNKGPKWENQAFYDPVE